MSPDRLVGQLAPGRLARRSGTAARGAVRCGADDRGRSDEAQRIQASRRGWVVMWSAWHRTFTAFSYFAPVPLVLDEPTTDALIRRMREVELYYSTARLNAGRA